MYQANLHLKQPKARWKDDVESDVRKTIIVNWRQIAQDGGEQLIFVGDSGPTEEEVVVVVVVVGVVEEEEDYEDIRL
jgi:hypothetical protein